MIYLYGLAETTADQVAQAIDGLPGLQAPPEVAAIDGTDWVVVFSAQDEEDILPKRRLMLTHTRVLENMLTTGPVLPARFGMVAESREDVGSLITQAAPRIRQEFNRIRGTVEVSVRISFPRLSAIRAVLAEDPMLQAERDRLAQRGPDAHFEIAAFGEKLADRLDRRRGAAQTVLLKAALPHVADHVLQAPEADNEVLRAAFLVPVEQQPQLEAALQDEAAAITFAPDAEPTIQIVGPAPAYNFVRFSLRPDQHAEDAA